MYTEILHKYCSLLYSILVGTKTGHNKSLFRHLHVHIHRPFMSCQPICRHYIIPHEYKVFTLSVVSAINSKKRRIQFHALIRALFISRLWARRRRSGWAAPAVTTVTMGLTSHLHPGKLFHARAQTEKRPDFTKSFPVHAQLTRWLQIRAKVTKLTSRLRPGNNKNTVLLTKAQYRELTHALVTKSTSRSRPGNKKYLHSRSTQKGLLALRPKYKKRCLSK